MISLVKIQAVLRKSIDWNSHPTEETFPELPDFLVSELYDECCMLLTDKGRHHFNNIYFLLT